MADKNKKGREPLHNREDDYPREADRLYDDGYSEDTDYIEEKKKKPPLSFKLMAVQSISCVAIITVVLFFRLIGGDSYNELKDSFNEYIMQNSIISSLASWLDLGKTPKEEIENDEDEDGDDDSEDEDEEKATTSAAEEPKTTEEKTEETKPEQSNDESVVVQSETIATNPLLPVSYSFSADSEATGKAKLHDIRISDGRVIFAPRGSSFAPLRVNVSPVYPVALEEGQISSVFGYRINPFDIESEEFHSGLDIAASLGTPISSLYYGRVKKVGNEPGYGNFIIIDHGNGLETLYAHCDKILAEQGSIIKAGEIIAHVGSTGRSTDNHLHLEVIFKEIMYDPSYVLDVSQYD